MNAFTLGTVSAQCLRRRRLPQSGDSTKFFVRGASGALVDANPTNLNYKVMLNSVRSALQNQPASATLDELKRAGEDVTQTLRGELDRELAAAQGLLERFEKWQLATEQTLKDALDHGHNA